MHPILKLMINFDGAFLPGLATRCQNARQKKLFPKYRYLPVSLFFKATSLHNILAMTITLFSLSLSFCQNIKRQTTL